MNVAIIGGSAQHLALVDNELMNLIEESGIYLFNVIGGFIYDNNDKPLSHLWAEYRGLPYYPCKYKDINELMNKMTQKADYIVFINDGSQIIKRFIMKFKMSGKHGSVINI